MYNLNSLKNVYICNRIRTRAAFIWVFCNTR